MKTLEKIKVTVESTISAPIEKVWNLWTDPRHIIHWNQASEDWFTPWAENDLRVSGKFLWRMEAKNGSNGFDFSGKYLRIESPNHIEYMIEDGRKVKLDFFTDQGKTRVTETFETENTNSVDLQREGWQSILNNFKNFVERSGGLEILHFETTINCDVEKVYKTMIDKEGYAQWTSAFNPSSRFEGSWKKGSKILFLGVNQNGTTEGMVSEIRENIPNKFISIEHQGIVQNDKEIIKGPEVSSWKGVFENYTFTPSGSNTLLSIDMDSGQEFKSYFIESWPGALDKLKTLCEK